jgi:hypothetical protein
LRQKLNCFGTGMDWWTSGKLGVLLDSRQPFSSEGGGTVGSGFMVEEVTSDWRRRGAGKIQRRGTSAIRSKSFG